MIEGLGGLNTLRERDDFYETPPLEVENILKLEKLDGSILENSCGRGSISNVLKKHYPDNNIISTDLIDRGFGECGLDFLSDEYKYTNVDNVVMNPPFKLLNRFIEKSIHIANKKVIMLGRIQVLETKGRYEIFKNNPPSRVYVYVDRISCFKGGVTKGQNAMCYAWYVWDFTSEEKVTELKWIRRAGV